MKQSLLKLAFAAVMLMLVAPFAGSQAVAQTHNLTGTVVDAQGNPVAGAAVVIDGTTKGTSTGSDGSFALNGVMANQSLLVTFIGYEPQTVAIGSQTNMKVVHKDVHLRRHIRVLGAATIVRVKELGLFSLAVYQICVSQVCIIHPISVSVLIL